MVAPFEVLAEPNRRRILELLGDRERPVGDLVNNLKITQPAVSKHLRILREAGLVEVRDDAQRRLYRVRSEPLKEMYEWLKPYRQLWERSLDKLEQRLGEIADSPSPLAGEGRGGG
jgi:DNA-binding transcriptional ArsR family regulator